MNNYNFDSHRDMMRGIASPPYPNQPFNHPEPYSRATEVKSLIDTAINTCKVEPSQELFNSMIDLVYRPTGAIFPMLTKEDMIEMGKIIFSAAFSKNDDEQTPLGDNQSF